MNLLQEASYAWEVNGGDVVATDNLLFFDKGVSRDQGGDYMCVAKNRHGRAEMVTRIEVICEFVMMIDKLVFDVFINYMNMFKDSKKGSI